VSFCHRSVTVSLTTYFTAHQSEGQRLGTAGSLPRDKAIAFET
jgi:hypothetical protein